LRNFEDGKIRKTERQTKNNEWKTVELENQVIDFRKPEKPAG
jgi:hypothetical protein